MGCGGWLRLTQTDDEESPVLIPVNQIVAVLVRDDRLCDIHLVGDCRVTVVEPVDELWALLKALK